MRSSELWSRPDVIARPSAFATCSMIAVLVAGWGCLYIVGVLGALWRMRDPDAPPPILTSADQRADLAVLGVQFAFGLAAVLIVRACRRRTLAEALPPRSGTAMQAAIALCSAVAAASATVLILDRIGVVRFDLAAPAVVESPWLAVISALATGLREEPLLVALPVLLLVGRIPIAWTMILAGSMRGVLYLYFGSGGFLWAFCWGAAAVWIYYRYRRLWVLIAVHGLVMNIQVLDRVFAHDNASTALQWCNILVLFGALMFWLVPRALDSVLPGDSAEDEILGEPPARLGRRIGSENPQ